MHKVLLTKSLDKEQEALAHDYNLNVIEQPFIKVTLEYDTVEPPKADVWIFTSSNAARYISANSNEISRSLYPELIVTIGSATANHLIQLGVPIKSPDYATAENVVALVKELNCKSAVFFSGNLRRNIIPEQLKDFLDFTEFQVYQTELLDHKIAMEEIEAVAFFSPSGVKGFSQSNTITNQKVIAVGTVTKQAVKDILGVRARISASPNMDDVLFALKEDLG